MQNEEINLKMGKNQLITLLCESCLTGETEIKTVWKPRYANSREVEPRKVLYIYCKKSYRTITKIIRKCPYYKPDPDKPYKVGKKVFKQCRIE